MKVTEFATLCSLFLCYILQLQCTMLGALCSSQESSFLKVIVLGAGSGAAELVKHCGCLAKSSFIPRSCVPEINVEADNTLVQSLLMEGITIATRHLAPLQETSPGTAIKSSGTPISDTALPFSVTALHRIS